MRVVQRDCATCIFGSRIHRRSLSLLAADRYFDPFDALLFHARSCRFRRLPRSLPESFESTRQVVPRTVEPRVGTPRRFLARRAEIEVCRSGFLTAGRSQEKGKTPGRFSLRARSRKDTDDAIETLPRSPPPPLCTRRDHVRHRKGIDQRFSLLTAAFPFAFHSARLSEC
jgi:hypothetical protein